MKSPMPHDNMLKWHKRHARFLDTMRSRLAALEDKADSRAVRQFRLAFDCQVRNAALYKEEGFVLDTGSILFQNAAVGVVFCAAALESAMSEALSVICLSTKPRIQRKLLMATIVALRWHQVASALKQFLPNSRDLEQSKLEELFCARNQILHGRPYYDEDYALSVVDGNPPRIVTKWIRRLNTPLLEDSEWVQHLPKYLDLCLRVMERLAAARHHYRSSGPPKMRKDHPILELRKHSEGTRKKRTPKIKSTH